MYVITAHQRYRRTDRRTDVKRSHDRYIAKACSGKNRTEVQLKRKEILKRKRYLYSTRYWVSRKYLIKHSAL